MNATTHLEIDGYRVEFERGGGWHCQCGAFERSNICEHSLLVASLARFEKKFAESALDSDVQYLALKRYVYRS